MRAIISRIILSISMGISCSSLVVVTGSRPGAVLILFYSPRISTEYSPWCVPSSAGNSSQPSAANFGTSACRT